MQEFCKEVCVDNIKDAMRAVDLGANRIEYCSKLSEEGLTPDIEDVKYLLKNINIPLRIMIRPHSKSFNYSETDISIMLRDISTFKKIDIDGIVIGCLNKDDEIDLKKINLLIEKARPLKVIFHKAIDITSDPLKSLKNLIKYSNINGVLTSGGFKKAEDGVKLLKKMLDICPINFELIIAGKITSENINKINQKLSAKFYHGKKIVGVL
ncbi:MAG: copper homeostasis protein CutC [Flavobacteriaceae bacterium]|nr:MAG: copper homeostasis protein CutC [Flavobacteriaceae bacterium]